MLRIPVSGSFLLMYFILLLLLGIPLMYMEMVIGQWLRMDNIQAWKYLVPWLSGVGYSNILMMIFSILFSNVLLLCFFIRTLFLNGSVRASLWRLVTIELSILSSLDAWRQAGGHVLYSLGLGMGTIITFSTYQPRGENYIKWASFVAMVNLATSLLSSFVIFLVMGFWTTTSGTMCIKRMKKILPS